jgi:hypothetical protein
MVALFMSVDLDLWCLMIRLCVGVYEPLRCSLSSLYPSFDDDLAEGAALRAFQPPPTDSTWVLCVGVTPLCLLVGAWCACFLLSCVRGCLLSTYLSGMITKARDPVQTFQRVPEACPCLGCQACGFRFLRLPSPSVLLQLLQGGLLVVVVFLLQSRACEAGACQVAALAFSGASRPPVLVLAAVAVVLWAMSCVFHAAASPASSPVPVALSTDEELPQHRSPAGVSSAPPSFLPPPANPSTVGAEVAVVAVVLWTVWCVFQMVAPPVSGPVPVPLSTGVERPQHRPSVPGVSSAPPSCLPSPANPSTVGAEVCVVAVVLWAVWCVFQVTASPVSGPVPVPLSTGVERPQHRPSVPGVSSALPSCLPPPANPRPVGAEVSMVAVVLWAVWCGLQAAASPVSSPVTVLLAADDERPQHLPPVPGVSSASPSCLPPPASPRPVEVADSGQVVFSRSEPPANAISPNSPVSSPTVSEFLPSFALSRSLLRPLWPLRSLPPSVSLGVCWLVASLRRRPSVCVGVRRLCQRSRDRSRDPRRVTSCRRQLLFRPLPRFLWPLHPFSPSLSSAAVCRLPADLRWRP